MANVPGFWSIAASASPEDDALSLRSATEAANRAIDWLTNRIGSDGDPHAGHCHYYRLPWALALGGRRAEASAVLSWVETTALQSNGDLCPEARGGFATRWSSYPLAILASGAWHLERYGTALRLVERLAAAYQDPTTGGAYAAHPDDRDDARQDLFPTAQLGMTGLTTGHHELAHGAYRWLRRLFEMQPELPDRLYSATAGSQLMTDPESDPELAWQIITDFTQPRQAFYNPGIAAAFLGRYYMATGAAEALQLAQSYIELTIRGTAAQFDYTESVQVCKFAWGAAVLLDATGDEAYLQHLRRMVPWFVSAQNADGSWDNSPFLMERGGDHASIRAEVTAEFVQHLISIISAIGGRHRSKAAEGDSK
jgi:hypothetical protein